MYTASLLGGLIVANAADWLPGSFISLPPIKRLLWWPPPRPPPRECCYWKADIFRVTVMPWERSVPQLFFRSRDPRQLVLLLLEIM